MRLWDSVTDWMHDHHAMILLGICLLGLLLRLVPITWGIPVDPFGGYYHPDEGKIVQAAQNFPMDILERVDLRYGTCYHYLIGFFTVPMRALAKIAGHDLSGSEGYLAHFVIARLFSVLLGTASVYVSFLLAKRLYGERTGLIAAFLVAVAQMHVLHSSWATVDVATSFWATLCLLLACRLMDRRSLGGVISLAVCAGALVGTKYTGAAIVPSVMLAYLWCWSGTRVTRRNLTVWIGGLAILLVGIVVTFLLTNPAVVLRPAALRDSVLFEMDRAATDGRDLRTVSALLATFDLATWWNVWGNIGERVLGMPLAFVSLLGLLYSIARSSKALTLVWVFVMGYSLVMGQETDGRYTIILVPSLCVLASGILASLRRHLGLSGRLLVVAVATYSLGFTGLALVSRLQPDPRTQAARYLYEHVPLGSSISIQGGGVDRRGTWLWPSLSRERYAVMALPYLADYVILNGRDLSKMREALQSPDLASGTPNSVATEFWFPDDIPSLTLLSFYDDVLRDEGRENGYRLLASFSSRPYVYLSFAAPDIVILESTVSRDRVTEPPPTFGTPTQLLFGDVAVLEAFVADDEVEAGKAAGIDLYWRAYELTESRYTAFVHILDLNYDLVAQSDQQPGRGVRPTNMWMRGELVMDSHTVILPEGTPPGEYRIEIGMYDSVSHSRLIVRNAKGDSLGSSTIVGVMRVGDLPPSN